MFRQPQPQPLAAVFYHPQQLFIENQLLLEQIAALKAQLTAESQSRFHYEQLAKKIEDKERVRGQRAKDRRQSKKTLVEYTKEANERAQKLEIKNEILLERIAKLEEENARLKTASQPSLVLGGSYVEAGLSIFCKPKLEDTAPALEYTELDKKLSGAFEA